MLNLYDVKYGYHKGSYGGTPHVTPVQHDVIAAADGNPSTLDAVLTSAGGNGRVTPAGFVRVFYSIANHGSSAVLS